MSENEMKRLQAVAENDAKIKRLFYEHQKLENKLATLQSKRYVTGVEESEEKRLKLLKLQKKDKMMSLLREHENQVANA